MEYQFIIVETVAVQRLYTVEADTEAEAREKAERGETVEESTLKTDGVVNRVVLEKV